MLVGSREKTSAADNLPAQTIVVFNAAVPDAESLANFTLKNAESPTITSSSSNCPTEEESRRNKLGVPTRNAMTSSVASWKNAIPS
jgi:hypothetical protein